jgi:coenzyme F420-reducing hydrogenase delta subunit
MTMSKRMEQITEWLNALKADTEREATSKAKAAAAIEDLTKAIKKTKQAAERLGQVAKDWAQRDL